MKKFHSEHSIVFSGPLEDFDERTDRLYEALLEMDVVEDPDLAMSMSAGCVEVSMVVEADDYPSAAQKAVCDLRAAIHAIGDATPGWEKHVRELRMALTPVVDDDEGVAVDLTGDLALS